MLILLPPSEGKSAPDDGPRLDVKAMSFPSLAPTRRRVLVDLISLCRGDLDQAAATLGLGVTQRGEVGANARLRRAPCAPAIEVYTGVLYEALDAASLGSRARRRLRTDVAISSALFGLVRPQDPIPSYRLSGSTALPGLGTLASVWRDPVSREIARHDGLIVDMRSGAYVSLGPIPTSVSERAATVRVLTERSGKRTVVSHFNKATKGRIVRGLVGSTRTPTDGWSLADVLDTLGYRVEQGTGRRDQPDVVDVIVDEQAL